MNELIKIENRGGIQTVEARELYNFLQVHSKFADWIKNRIEKYNFIEGQDFVTLSKSLENGGSQKEYYISLDMAKEFSMVENNEKGKEARRYFIECEKKLNSYRLPGKTDDEIIALGYGKAMDRIKLLESVITSQKPKVEFFDAVADSKTAVDLGTVAKVIDKGLGRNELFQFLRERKVLMANNIPYQQFIDQGYFRVIEQKYNKKDGTVCINFKTLVYQAGVKHIIKLLDEPIRIDEL